MCGEGKKSDTSNIVVMDVTITTVLLLLVLRDALGDDEESLYCYECGTGVAGEPDCEDFIQASSWASFWRKCQKDHICVKSVPSWASGDESRTVRGCSPRKNLQGVPYKEGCWSHATSTTIICFCTTNSCNTASTITLPALTLTTLLVLSILFR